MRELEGVEIEDNKVLVDVVEVVEEVLKKLVVDSEDFDEAKKKIEDNTYWKLFRSSSAEYDREQLADAEKVCQQEGYILLKPEQDPDPFGNHGIPIHDRLAAMGWPADRKLYLERQDVPRVEDLL